MSERKVLNKYYPPDFDPSKLPRVKREKNRQFIIRLMAPFNMRCKTCGEYIYRGKKFNARKEDVIGSTYLGIQIYRFYIKCTKCLAEITFVTDPESQDYKMEFGAIRNFESVRLAEIQAEQDSKREKEEEENNPMKVLENRTRDSRREMAAIETLEDLRELNAAHSTVDLKALLEENEEAKRRLEKEQEEEDEREVQRLFGKKKPAVRSTVDPLCDIIEEIIGEVDGDESDDDQDSLSLSKKIKSEPTELDVKKIKTEHVIDENPPAPTSILFKKPAASQPAPSTVLNKNKLSTLIKKKPEIVENSKSARDEVKSNALSSLAAYSSSEESD